MHGWVYDITDGLLRDLGITANGEQDRAASYAAAVAQRPSTRS